jgi:hypothetical protein
VERTHISQRLLTVRYTYGNEVYATPLLSSLAFLSTAMTPTTK